MAGNIYDDAVDQLPPPPGQPSAADDPYGPAADQVIARRIDGQRAGVDRSADTPPDRAADVIRLSQRYGLAPAVVERNFTDIQKRARQDDTPHDALLRDTPALADYISDPYRAAAVQDDLEPLAVLERTVGVMANSVRSVAAGLNRFNVGVWGTAQQAAELVGNDALAAYFKAARVQAGEIADIAKGPQTGASELEQAFYAGFESVGLMIPGMLMSAASGSPTPMLATIGTVTSGEGFGRARDEGKGVARASLFGFTQGGVEVVTEMIPAIKFMKALKTHAGFKAMVMNVLPSELLGEQGATFFQDLDDWATFNPTAPFSTFLAERPSAALHTLISTITAVGATTAIASATQKFAGDAGKAARAEESKSFFDTIAKTVGSMKSAEKHPQSIETVIAQATAGTPIEKLYAPIETFTSYWQQLGEDPAQKATELTGDPDAYANALTTGADLAIPTATYAARVANTDHHAYFVNELRIGPDEMNVREATAFKEEQATTAQATTDEATAAASPTAAIGVALRQQLEGAGVETSTAAAYTELFESTFGSLAERAGVDPTELFARYGVTVERLDLTQKTAEAAQTTRVAAQPTDVQQAFSDLVRDKVEEGAAARAAGTDVPDSDAARRLEAERILPETGDEPGEIVPVDAPAAAPGGDLFAEARATITERRATAARLDAVGAPVQFRDDTRGTSALAGPDMSKPGAFRVTRFDATGSPIGHTEHATLGEAVETAMQAGYTPVLDKQPTGAETTEGFDDAGTEQGANRLIDRAGSPRGDRVEASDPGNDKSGKRGAKHFARVFNSILNAARSIDPAVNEAELKAEFDYRLAFYNDQKTLEAESGTQPHAILRAVATYGGISLDPKAERHAEIAELRDLATAFGAIAGVRGVFRRPTKGKRGQMTNAAGAGVPIDVMLQQLQADPEFAWIESIDMLLDQIDDAARHGVDTISKTELPGTEELRDVGILREREWWARAWRPVDLLEEEIDETEPIAGDTSFDVAEFNQSLFDEFDALAPDTGVDTLVTGEQQPRLPEAGQVREQEVATPEIAEAPFSLTAPTGKPQRRKGPIAGQTTLFQEDSITVESVRTWAADVKRRAGPDVKAFDVNLTIRGNLSLDSVVVARGAQRAGLGSKLVKELTRFADANGLRVVLTPGQRDPLHGTTSRARLVKFYKRFGFVENKGRHKDFRISSGMFREPTLPAVSGAKGSLVSADARFVRAGEQVDGLAVRASVPNTDSIAASLSDYEELPGVRVVRFADFSGVGAPRYYSPQEEQRTQQLAAEIDVTGEINPLIVVIDKDGPYVLEGGHRFDALQELGKTEFPAVVVVDLDRPTVLGQPLFHGTPHNVDRFSLDKVGTGEGAAAYGWGLYFAENPKIAGHYFDTLSGNPQIKLMKLGSMRIGQFNGFDYSRRAGDNDVENVRASLAEDLLIHETEMLGRAGQFQQIALERLDQKIADYKNEWPEGVVAAEQLRAELAKPGAATIEYEPTSGGVYQVDIDEKHIAKMLNWDAPITEQPEPVQTLVREKLKELGYLRPKDDGPRVLVSAFKAFVNEHGGMAAGATGETIYQTIVQAEREKAIAPIKDEWAALRGKSDRVASFLGPGGRTAGLSVEERARFNELDKQYNAAIENAPKLASLLLADRGVPGLRYFDAPSRDDKKGTRNVVAFDESIITITHKDGSPITDAERKEYLQEVQAGDTTLNAGEPIERRGAIRFGADRQFTISLLEKADLSTFLHESGHLFLEVFGDLADGLRGQTARTEQQQKALDDYDALLKWLGVANRGEITAAHHEQFARGFEAYLMEGKAPSIALRSAFGRFRAWMLAIYRSLKGLKVDLSDDVRRVLDRMVASDQAIAQAEAEGIVTPMFTTADSAGMTPERFALYRQEVANASRKAREALDTRLLAEVQREQTAQWKAQRAEIHTAVEAETHAMPRYIAIAAMQRGTKPNGDPLVEGMTTPPVKLSRKLIADQFGAERLKRLPRPYVYSKDGGLDPGVAAMMFGYTSADELLTAIENAEPMARRIERETDRRMLEQHGSILLDGTLHEKAQAAVANEHREEIVREELRALGRLRRTVSPFVRQAEKAVAAEKDTEIDALTGQVRALKGAARGGAARINAALPPATVINEAARIAVARMKVREIKPAVYWAAARRASQKARDAAARQDFDTAITAAQQELMNLAVFREASRVVEDVEVRVQRALDLARPAAQQRLGKAGDSYLEQVNTLLDRYDFARQTGKVLDRRESLRVWVQALQAQGLPVEIPDDVLDDTRRIHYRELTVEELVGVSDALDHIVHLSVLKNKLLKSAAGRELLQTAQDLARSIRGHFTGTRDETIETHLPAAQTKRSVAGFFAAHRKLASLVRQLDGFEDGGPMWEAFMRPLNEAADRETVMNAAATKALSAIVQTAYPGRERVRLYEKTHIPAIGISLTKMGRVMVALNWGNEQNRQRIRDGYRWTDQQVGAILDTLDARDWAFIQGTWDFIGSYWQEIADKQQRVTGVVPTKVEAIPVPTKFGTFNGGYWPLKYNERLEAQAGENLDLEAANLAKQAAYVHATTRRGHTKERVKNVKLKVRLDFGVLFEHVTQVIHDLSHHEILIDVGRVLGQRDVQQAIYETHGELVYREIKDGLRDVAFGIVPAVKFHEKAINHLRVGATIAGLGWNLTTAMLQPIGLTQSAVRIGPKWVGRGMARWLSDAATMTNTVAWINERSSFMKLRGQTQQREINEIRNKVGVNTGRIAGWVDDILRTTTGDQVSRQGVADSFFFLIQQMQRIADVPTWLGQYEKSMAAGETEARAAALADQAVLDSQAGGQVKDLASVQRGGPLLRLWTNFYSFFNTTYNLTVESTKRTNFKKPGQVGRLAVDYVLLYTVPASLGYMLREALKPGDDDEGLVEGLIRENLGYLLGTVIGLRELSGSVQGYYGYEGPAGARAFSSAARLVKQIEQGDADAAFWRALNDTAGVLFHYPSGQTRRTIEGIAAIAEGETTNPGAVVVGAPR